jgi:urease accessory protein
MNMGGGLVDGDAVDIEIDVLADATACFSTLSTSKVYKGSAGQSIHARIASGGLLVWAPEPTVCFEAARFSQDVCIEMAEGASLLWVEGLLAGRVESGERYAFHCVTTSMRVESKGLPIFIDALRLSRDDGELEPRFRRFSATGMIVCVGPRALPLAASWFEPSLSPAAASNRLAVSRLSSGDALARVLAVDAQSLARELGRLTADLCEVLGDDPAARKW